MEYVRILGVAVQRPFEEVLCFPLRADCGAVGQLKDETGISDVCAVFEASAGVGIAFCRTAIVMG